MTPDLPLFSQPPIEPESSQPARRASDLLPLPDPFTVSSLTVRLKKLIEGAEDLRHVSVIGEISGFKHHMAKHMYFQMKDSGAVLKCVFFHPANRSIDFAPADGTEVVVSGSIQVYPTQGTYQMYVRTMTRSGAGILYRKYEELKKKLIEEGLTSADRKRSLPAFPVRIGIVASTESAGLQDMLNVLRRRYPLAEVVIAPVAVEGEASAPSIVAGLKLMAERGNADVVIVGRGGGSIESLWGFNTELVARAIASMPMPVITAVGHETDTTIADLVADRRAATPTEAAELATPSITDLRAAVSGHRDSLRNLMIRKFSRHEERFKLVARTLRSPYAALNLRTERVDRLMDAMTTALGAGMVRQERRLDALRHRLLLRSPQRRLAETSARLDRAVVHARHAVSARYADRERSFSLAAARLAGASPIAILGRGYAIALQDGHALKDAAQAPPGSEIKLRLHRGQLTAEVKKATLSES